MTNAPDVPAERWFAMTRLDQNRAKTQLAKRAGVPVTDVKNVAIWGNHSSTKYADAANATVGGKPPTTSSTTPRGSRASSSRRSRSAGPPSSRRAVCRQPRRRPTPRSTLWSAWSIPRAADDCASLAVASRGEYGTPEGLQFGFPVASDGKGGWAVKEGFELDDFAREKIRVTTEELEAEQAEVANLLSLLEAMMAKPARGSDSNLRWSSTPARWR